jgi:3-hydroxyisobutyrate dehydrogenase-like beta-hydroxyacid dehydrogenase
MATVAFLGLGQMGGRMAGRLVAAGHEVTVWNRTRAKAEAVTGARVADTPGAAAAGSDIVITMLADPAAVNAVVDAMDLRPGTVLVEMSTIGPRAVADLARRLPEGVGLVDAPVGGSIGKAEAGELTVFTGGTDADVDRVTPVLEALGTVQHRGGPGSAAAAKLVVNTALIAGLALLGELRELAGELAVPAEDLLASGPLAALVTRATGAGAHFTVALAEKDLSLVTEHATDKPLTEAALARIRSILPHAGDQELGTLADPRRTDA